MEIHRQKNCTEVLSLLEATITEINKFIDSLGERVDLTYEESMTLNFNLGLMAAYGIVLNCEEEVHSVLRTIIKTCSGVVIPEAMKDSFKGR